MKIQIGNEMKYGHKITKWHPSGCPPGCEAPVDDRSSQETIKNKNKNEIK